MNKINFIWDENKNEINKKKHGLSFEEASEVVAYFKTQSESMGIPYQTLINLYLSDCVASKRVLQMSWK